MRYFLLLCAVVVAGCVTEPDEREFVIKVDSVRAPGVVSGGAPFEVRFFGRVGTSGCYRFKESRLTQSDGAADVTLIGVGPDGRGRTCSDNIVGLDLRLTISPPIADPFELRVHQPSDEILSKTIRAE